MNNQTDHGLSLYRTDFNAKNKVSENTKIKDAPLMVGILTHFGKKLTHESLYVSENNPLDDGIRPSLPNMEVYPLSSAEEAAYVAYYENMNLFVDISMKEDFQTALDEIIAKKAQEQDEDPYTKLGKEIAARAIKIDPALSKMPLKREVNTAIKDIVYFSTENSAESIDEVLNAVSSRVIHLLNKKSFVTMKEKRILSDEKKLSTKILKWLKGFQK